MWVFLSGESEIPPSQTEPHVHGFISEKLWLTEALCDLSRFFFSATSYLSFCTAEHKEHWLQKCHWRHGLWESWTWRWNVREGARVHAEGRGEECTLAYQSSQQHNWAAQLFQCCNFSLKILLFLSSSLFFFPKYCGFLSLFFPLVVLC